MKEAKALIDQEYKYGFVTEIEADTAPRGLNEDIIRFISKKKKEPKFMLEWRLRAYQRWLKMKEPNWQNVKYPAIDYQDMIYYSAPKSTKDGPKSLDEVDDEILKTYEKLGIPLEEQKRLAGVAANRDRRACVGAGRGLRGGRGNLGVSATATARGADELT